VKGSPRPEGLNLHGQRNWLKADPGEFMQSFGFDVFLCSLQAEKLKMGNMLIKISNLKFRLHSVAVNAQVQLLGNFLMKVLIRCWYCFKYLVLFIFWFSLEVHLNCPEMFS